MAGHLLPTVMHGTVPERYVRPKREAIPESLGLERSHVVTAMGQHAQHMAVSPQPELTCGLPGHKSPDATATTLLLQDGVSGLQVQRNGRWVAAVNRVPDVLAIDIGDQLQIGGGAVAWFGAKMNSDINKCLLYRYWLLLVVSVMVLTCNFFPDGGDDHGAVPQDQLITPALAMFSGLMCAICLVFRAVKQMM
ncbi:protein DMR6-LIKE OXYGENASE 2-like [Phragmites australis]|uniref:protein DMR6-LIKE OXYGENASE 2-like n=1 Tax=Phragmites australis TaxID=29695 RepID=UPI002D79A2E1|nr:protein DMR6-LIKE OXYGENASE 2-like [Phragmites australis]